VSLALVLSLPLLLGVPATAVAARTAEHAVCYLKLRGHSSSSSIFSSADALEIANLTCITSSDGTPASVAVGINTTYLGGTTTLFTSGVVQLQDDACKQHTATFAFQSMLFFCGSYSVDFEQPFIDHV
jgi:hypothetical protein